MYFLVSSHVVDTDIALLRALSRWRRGCRDDRVSGLEVLTQGHQLRAREPEKLSTSLDTYYRSINADDAGRANSKLLLVVTQLGQHECSDSYQTLPLVARGEPASKLIKELLVE